MNNDFQSVISFAEFELDKVRRQLRRNGEIVQLNAKTFDLLVFLLERNGETLSKDEILEGVWAGQFVEEANLSVQMSALRKMLGEKKDAPRFLVTIPGVGYRFVADIETEKEEFVIEKHKVERLTVDEEIDESSDLAPKQLTDGNHQNRSVILSAAGLVLLMLIGLAAYKYFYVTPEKRVGSLAVLPFTNQNGDPNTEYLSEGLAESVIYSLSAAPDLRVMSRGSAFRFKSSDTDAKIVGKELNVEAVLTGRIVLLGDNISIRTELISAADNTVIWGEQFTRKFTDVEKLQIDIAQSISQKLRLKLLGSGDVSLQNNHSENPEAYRLYLLGRFHLNKLTDEGFRKSRDYFEQAIEKDPEFAPAHAGLAEVYNRLSGYNVISPNEGYPKARVAAEKAIELNDRLAEAHATLGTVKHFYDWDFSGAEKEFKRAIEINPNNADARQLYSYYLSSQGRFDEALAEMRRAVELDPLSLEKIAGIAEIFRFQRQPDRAMEQYRIALEMDANSGFLHWAIGNVYMQKKMYREAINEYQKSIPLSGDSPDEPASLAYAYALSGNRREALQIIEDLRNRSKSQYISPLIIAVIYGGLGEKEQAFEWLEKGYNGRDMLMVLLKADPMFDSLRDDPRFTELMLRVGLQR